jgi:hypothetical protein
MDLVCEEDQIVIPKLELARHLSLDVTAYKYGHILRKNMLEYGCRLHFTISGEPASRITWISNFAVG